jgi:putative membrane-bound dehydrogenase-like protein
MLPLPSSTPGRLLAGTVLVTVAHILAPLPSQAAPAPAPLAEAVERMEFPSGFEVTLFAGEPDIVQPIAMTLDDRGRLWVVECLAYPDWTHEKEGNDRVIIMEDTTGDGRFDERTIFYDKGRNLSGIAVGFGGVWLCSAPELIFIPDRDGDGRPDGPPEVMLDGWTLEAKHNVVNGLSWGPDGWLYGCHGILGDSFPGAPGAPPEERPKINCGIWRFHPVRRQFEVVAHGTTNPWGIAFNSYGQMFIANCVIKHLFHVIPGARFERMYGQDQNPHAFALMESCADHIHWAGGFWKTEGAEHPQNDEAGGGHAHSGAMIYLGDNWPEQYRDTFFTINIHGFRINHDALERQGSGYVARHRPDFLKANDPWFRAVALLYGPDGGVYVSDWSDDGECHDYDVVHRQYGRIYKITYGRPPHKPQDLRKLADLELAQLQLHPNEWQASRARLLLQERHAQGKLSPQTRARLNELLQDGKETVHRLRALWALHVSGGLNSERINQLLQDPDEWIRGWTIQLALEHGTPSNSLLEQLATLASSEPSPVVRLYLASALQRLPLEKRPPIAGELLARAEDSNDPNLPLMLWYGIEPLVSADDSAAPALLDKTEIPLVRQFIARRLALRLSHAPLIQVLEQSSRTPEFQRDVIEGMHQALKGRRNLPMPAGWLSLAPHLMTHPDQATRDNVLALSLIFNDPEALAMLRKRVEDHALSPEARRSALEALVRARPAGLAPFLTSLLDDPAIRSVSIRGLGAWDFPPGAQAVLERYSSLRVDEKAEAIQTLSSRPSYAMLLLDGLEKGVIRSREVTPYVARQLQALNDPKVTDRMQSLLGEIRPVDEDKAGQIEHYKEFLIPEALAEADLAKGRQLYLLSCAPCHVLFDEGNPLGPELTGSQRANLDYILENVIDPNAVVWNQYRATYFETADDRLISGVVLEENESTVTIQTQTAIIVLPQEDIITRTISSLSIMPEGLFDALEEQEVIDLVAYLQSPTPAR